MLAPIALLVFAVAMAAVGPRMLVRAAWVKRAPGWGVLAWQGLTASLVVAILMLGLVLAAPLSPLADAMAYMWATNVPEVVEHYLTPAGYGLASTAVVGLAALMLRLCSLTAVTARNTSRARRAQASVLDLVGRSILAVSSSSSTPRPWCTAFLGHAADESWSPVPHFAYLRARSSTSSLLTNARTFVHATTSRSRWHRSCAEPSVRSGCSVRPRSRSQRSSRCRPTTPLETREGSRAPWSPWVAALPRRGSPPAMSPPSRACDGSRNRTVAGPARGALRSWSAPSCCSRRRWSWRSRP